MSQKNRLNGIPMSQPEQPSVLSHISFTWSACNNAHAKRFLRLMTLVSASLAFDLLRKPIAFLLARHTNLVLCGRQSRRTIKEAVRNGLSVSIVFESSVADEVRCGHLPAVRLREIELAKDLHIVHQREMPSEGPTWRFVDLLAGEHFAVCQPQYAPIRRRLPPLLRLGPVTRRCLP
jgi:DNA-binding transcriptional LysR family regulator